LAKIVCSTTSHHQDGQKANANYAQREEYLRGIPCRS